MGSMATRPVISLLPPSWTLIDFFSFSRVGVFFCIVFFYNCDFLLMRNIQNNEIENEFKEAAHIELQS